MKSWMRYRVPGQVPRHLRLADCHTLTLATPDAISTPAWQCVVQHVAREAAGRPKPLSKDLPCCR